MLPLINPMSPMRDIGTPAPTTQYPYMHIALTCIRHTRSDTMIKPPHISTHYTPRLRIDQSFSYTYTHVPLHLYSFTYTSLLNPSLLYLPALPDPRNNSHFLFHHQFPFSRSKFIRPRLCTESPGGSYDTPPSPSGGSCGGAESMRPRQLAPLTAGKGGCG